MNRRMATATGFICAASMAFASMSPASAQEYPVTTGDLAVTEAQADGILTEGESIAVSGGGFAPGAEVTIRLVSAYGGTSVQVGVVTADASGNIDTTITVPAGLDDGTYTLVATGDNAAGGQLALTSTVSLESNSAITTSTSTTSTTSLATTTTSDATTSTTDGATSTTSGFTTTTDGFTTTTVDFTSTTSRFTSTTTRFTTTTTGSRTLPITGSSAMPLAAGATALVAAGGGVLYYRKRSLATD